MSRRRKRERVPATWTRERHRVTGDIVAETERGLVARRDEGPADHVFEVLVLVRRDFSEADAAVELRRLADELGSARD